MTESLKTYATQRPATIVCLVLSLIVLLICQFAKTSAPATRTITSSIADTSTTAVAVNLDKQTLSASSSDWAITPAQKSSELELELVPIEQIKVGMRVPALNPEVTAEERATFKDPDPATWQLMELEHQKPDGGLLLISMLRPIEWIHQQGIHSGGSFQIDMPELGAKGLAKVLALKPCPQIQAGPGHVVLSTFAHPATHEILDVTIGEGEDIETIGVTETHPFWSVQDQAFVPVGHLVAGSQVLTADEQTKTITSILPRPGPAQQVYNLEVNGEHVYYVGDQQLLVHNNSCERWVYVLKRDNKVVYVGYGSEARATGADSPLQRIADAAFGGSKKAATKYGFTQEAVKLSDEFRARGMEQKIMDYFGGPALQIGSDIKWTKDFDRGLLNKINSWRWERGTNGDVRGAQFYSAYLDEALFLYVRGKLQL